MGVPATTLLLFGGRRRRISSFAYGEQARYLVKDSAITTISPRISGISYPATGAFAVGAGGDALPTGLSLDADTGAITGTPTVESEVAAVEIELTDSAARVWTALLNFSIGVVPVISYADDPATDTLGDPASHSVTVTAGTATITYALQSGTLPASYSLNPATGAITSAEVTQGDVDASPYAVVVRATNAWGTGDSNSFDIDCIDEPAPLITYPSSDVTWYDYFTSVSLTPDASGGGVVTSYAVTAGALPAGVTIDAGTGVISGTPTALKTDAIVTITATNDGGTDTFDITIEVKSMLLWPGDNAGPALLVGYDTAVGFSSIKSASDGTGNEAADTEPAGWMTDLSGNGDEVIQATVGAKPTVDADGIASKRCITFDGGDFLNLAAFTGGAQAQPVTVVAVMLHATGTNVYMIDGGTSTTRAAIFQTASGWQYYGGVQLDGAARDQNLHLHIALFSGASSKGYVDGTEGASGDAGAQDMNGISVGARYDGAGASPAGSKGSVWAAYDGDIGATARGHLRTWATAKWGTP